MSRPACVFDLDGTLLRAFPEGDTTRGPRNWSEMQFLPGVRADIHRLTGRGFLPIVCTNKPDIARRLMTFEDWAAICRLAARGLGIRKDKFYLCPHDNPARCSCRKPHPMMFTVAAHEHDISLETSWSIGDRKTDREAAVGAGIPIRQTIIIPTNQGITEAVQWILDHAK